jgi:hypothetical protein
MNFYDMSEYGPWRRMKGRCYDKNNNRYPLYGARGIQVCDRWRDDFWQFLSDVGPRPGPTYSLDRIDCNGNYELGNVRWATREEQQRNKRNNHLVDGIALSAALERSGNKISYSRAWHRAKHGVLPSERLLEDRNWVVRVSDDQIQNIRRSYATGLYSQRELAREFDISQTHISRIVRGEMRR